MDEKIYTEEEIESNATKWNLIFGVQWSILIIVGLFLIIMLGYAIVTLSNPFKMFSGDLFIMWFIIVVVCAFIIVFCLFQEEGFTKKVGDVTINGKIQMGYSRINPPLYFKNNKNKSNMTKISKVLIIAGCVLLIISVGFNFYNTSVNIFNTQIELRNNITQKLSERDVITNELMFNIEKSLDITDMNQDAYMSAIKIVMSARQDQPNSAMFFKWVTEMNPNLDYAYVSSFYQNMLSLYREQRNAIIIIEREIQILKLKDDNLRMKFPSNLFLKWFGNTDEIQYKSYTTY